MGTLTHEVRAFSELVAAEVVLGPTSATLPLTHHHEHGIFVVQGSATVDGEPLSAGTLRYLGRHRSTLHIQGAPGTRLMLVGGAPLGEPVLMWWNFVGRSDAEVRAWHADWQQSDGQLAAANTPKVPAPPLP